ncbi:MAG TPA: FAD-binding oxidoreductase [Kofleriaceae bacterium]|nr:FAD-binding oxidoreductase [Kofleriaceae bacterium]
MRAVIIGGGVMGASAAYHLAFRGVRELVVLDGGRGPGEGSTGRATGGFRAQFASAVNVRLSLLAREALRRFRDEIGGDAGYDPRGYLWLAGTPAQLARLGAAREVQRAAGLTEAALVSVDDIARLNPGIDTTGLVGGAFCPTDGFIRPVAMLEAYLAAARRLGARVEWGAQVVALERKGERITAVRTARESLPADVVVNAAGAWAERVAALAGFGLPVVPLKRQILPTAPQDALPTSMPMTIFGDGFHLRVREDRRALLVWPDPAPPAREGDARYDTSVEPAWLDAVAARSQARVPALHGVALDRAGAWAGLYEMSPDRHAILGAAPGCPNLYLVNGSSGHGAMHSPALGRLVAEIICGEPPSIDVAPLRPSRFAEGALNPAADLL